jgi:hypothetical protein
MRTADQFLDSHPEIAEQLRKNPSLVNDQKFVSSHPALQQFLQQHPGVREEFTENPQAFMQQQERFENQANNANRGTEGARMPGFQEFLQGHANIASQLAKNPSLVSNAGYLAKHPELQEFLKTHPNAAEEFQENPQAFLNAKDMNSAAFASPKSAGTTPKSNHR